jgi:uncharacterized protein YhjY with autotransporter beta-barrel domain
MIAVFTQPYWAIASRRVSRDLWDQARRFVSKNLIFIVSFSSVPGFTMAALDDTGKNALSNLVVDASLGDFSHTEAMAIAQWLNTVDPRLYGFNFSKDSTNYLLERFNINQDLAAKDQQGADLTTIFGPGHLSLFNFSSQGASCSGSRSLGGSDPQTCLEYVPGLNSSVVNSVATLVQLTTISNTFSRPTAQFQRDIRRFVAHSFSNEGSGGGASADGYLFEGRMGTYFSGGGSFGSLDAKSSPIAGQGRDGFSTYNQTGTGALDYQLSDWAILGTLLNYTGTQNFLANSGGRLYADSYRVMPFLSLIPFDNAYVDIMAGYGHQAYSNFATKGLLATAQNFNSNQALASVDLGYNLAFESLELTGFAGGSFISTNVSGYRDALTGLTVMPYTVSSWTSTLGAQAAYSISTSVGVVQPVVRLEWVHAFNTSEQTTIVNPSGGLQPIQSVAGVPDWANITAGVQSVLPEGITAFLNYQGQAMAGGRNQGVMAGLRMEY